MLEGVIKEVKESLLNVQRNQRAAGGRIWLTMEKYSILVYSVTTKYLMEKFVGVCTCICIDTDRFMTWSKLSIPLTKEIHTF